MASSRWLAATGLRRRIAQLVNLSVARAYREAMQDLAQRKRLDIWYARRDMDEIRSSSSAPVDGGREAKRFKKNMAKAADQDSLRRSK